MITKAKINYYNKPFSLYEHTHWRDVVAIPTEWVICQIGIFKRENILFPVDNISHTRDELI